MKSPSSLQTRTGGFPIGFRRMGWAWCRDTKGLVDWAVSQKFGVIDLLTGDEQDLALCQKAGLQIGTVDLHPWEGLTGMLSADQALRDDAVAKAAARIRACSRLGVTKFFTLMLAGDSAPPARETFRYMVESHGALLSVLEETQSRISIEGWPERQAHCCNPESLRAFFAEIKSPSFGVNYDPSHLIRLGIDHVRFLHEFVDRVVHVHGKDTEIFPEKIYELGYEQNLARMSGPVWRYTIPGHGQARWPVIFQILQKSGYTGAVSIEHEDQAFIGTPELEQQGLLFSAQFLAMC